MDPIFRHLDDADVPWQQVKRQRNADGTEASVWEKWLAFSAEPPYLSLYAKYDPGMIVRRHGHNSPHVVFVIEGDLWCGDRHCRAGTHIELPQGAAFGPLRAGDGGATLFEVMLGIRARGATNQNCSSKPSPNMVLSHCLMSNSTSHRGSKTNERAGTTSHENCDVVRGRGTVAAAQPAARAFVDDHELTAFVEESDRLHRGATVRCPVARMDVDVRRPKAVRAVVRVAVASDGQVAVQAAEVFAGAREAPRQKAPRFVEPNGARLGNPCAGSPFKARASGRRSRYLRVRTYAVDKTPTADFRSTDGRPTLRYAAARLGGRMPKHHAVRLVARTGLVAAVILTGWFRAGVAMADSGLVWPEGDLTLQGEDSPFKGTIAVDNPTPAAIVVTASEPQPSGCEVTVDQETATVPAHRMTTITFTVGSGADNCSDPRDGKTTIAFSTNVADGPVEPEIAYSVAKAPVADEPEEAESTGLLFPTEVRVHKTDDKVFVGAVDVFNPTDDEITVTDPVPDEGAACGFDVSEGEVVVPPHTGVDVAVKSGTDCSSLFDQSLKFDLRATSSHEGAARTDVATVEAIAQPNWTVIVDDVKCALLVAGIALLVGFACCHGKGRWNLEVDDSAPPSWATSSTAIVSLVTGLFAGTELLKQVLGEGINQQLTLMAVGSAVAVALSGSAGLVTGVPGKTGYPRVWQFLVGAALTLAGALTELQVVRYASKRFALSIDTFIIDLTAFCAGLALLSYLVFTVKFYVSNYAKNPNRAPTSAGASDEQVAAVMMSVAPYFLARPDPLGKWNRAAWLANSKTIADELVNGGVAPPTNAADLRLVAAAQFRPGPPTRPKVTRYLL